MGDHDLFEFRFTEIYNFFSVRFLKNTISFFHSSNSMLAKENPARGHMFRIEPCYEIYKIYDVSRLQNLQT